MMHKMVNGKKVRLTAEERSAVETDWAKGDEEINRLAALAYREKRKRAYIESLGLESDQTNTIGDVLDVVIKKLRAMEAGRAEPEFDAMVREIDRIKAENPKP